MRPTKYIYIAVLLLISSVLTFGQTVTVSYLKAVPSRSFNNTKDSVIVYPIFYFKNKALRDNINKTVKSEFYKLYEKNKSIPIKAVLKSLAKEGLAELSYEKIRNDNRFFSFVIYHEWIAAYPSYHNAYYAFDIKSGQRLIIDSLIMPERKIAFKEFVITKWKDSLVKYREELLTQLKDKEIDSTDYKLALEYTKDDCLKSYSSKDFKLGNETLEIFFECPFPRVMLPINPSGSIMMPFETISEYLRPKYRP